MFLKGLILVVGSGGWNPNSVLSTRLSSVVTRKLNDSNHNVITSGLRKYWEIMVFVVPLQDEYIVMRCVQYFFFFLESVLFTVINFLLTTTNKCQMFIYFYFFGRRCLSAWS
jgi:hypothetical protein